MSRRAELLLLCLRYLKKRQARETVPIPAIRRRLKLIERIVPLPPTGTRTQVIDADGIRAVHITVPKETVPASPKTARGNSTSGKRDGRYLIDEYNGAETAWIAP